MKKIFLFTTILITLIILLVPLSSQAAVPPAAQLFRLLRTATPTPIPLILNFTVTPTSGNAPLAVTLRAQETSANTGNFSFYFWCNNSSSGTAITGADNKVENTAGKTQTFACTYSSVGTYSPKVVLTKAGASSVESRKSVTVTAAPPTPTGPGGQIIFAKDGEAIRIKGSLVADQIVFNVRKKNAQSYAAMIYSDAKVLYAALPGFETLVDVMIQ